MKPNNKQLRRDTYLIISIAFFFCAIGTFLVLLMRNSEVLRILGGVP